MNDHTVTVKIGTNFDLRFKLKTPQEQKDKKYCPHILKKFFINYDKGNTLLI